MTLLHWEAVLLIEEETIDRKRKLTCCVNYANGIYKIHAQKKMLRGRMYSHIRAVWVYAAQKKTPHFCPGPLQVPKSQFFSVRGCYKRMLPKPHNFKPLESPLWGWRGGTLILPITGIHDYFWRFKILNFTIFWVSRFCQQFLWVCQFEQVFCRVCHFPQVFLGCQFMLSKFRKIIFMTYHLVYA